MERLLLIACSFLLLVVELLNTAIETVVDRISLELHPLSKRAKDLGGAARLVAVIMTIIIWGRCCWEDNGEARFGIKPVAAAK